jgi:hypothetical protein
VRSTLVPRSLVYEIENEIAIYPNGLLKKLVDYSLSADGKSPLAIKFIPVKWARTYLGATAKLKISTTLGFTWGTGTYVTPTAFPISSAIFGRIGVVAQFDPTGWRVFDATRPQARVLYLSWLQFQPLYQVLALTLHSQLANQYLRDLFRTTFRIDCVLFHPDQLNLDYTRSSDVWMNVTDWASTGEILNSFSDRLRNPRATIIVEEEFESTANNIGRNALIGPLSPRPANVDTQMKIASAYQSGSLLRLTA